MSFSRKCALVPDGNRLSGAAVGWRRGSGVGSVDDLLTLDPIEVIRKSYQNKFRCEMRDELVELARRAVEAARREGGNE